MSNQWPNWTINLTSALEMKIPRSVLHQNECSWADLCSFLYNVILISPPSKGRVQINEERGKLCLGLFLSSNLTVAVLPPVNTDSFQHCHSSLGSFNVQLTFWHRPGGLQRCLAEWWSCLSGQLVVFRIFQGWTGLSAPGIRGSTRIPLQIYLTLLQAKTIFY